jgi:hypothetical protein
MVKNKKAYLVDVNLCLRITIDEDLDPNIDPEFDQAVVDKIKSRMQEEGDDFLKASIHQYEDDTECPYNSKLDNQH